MPQSVPARFPDRSLVEQQKIESSRLDQAARAEAEAEAGNLHAAETLQSRPPSPQPGQDAKSPDATTPTPPLYLLLRSQLNAAGNPMVSPAPAGVLSKIPHIASVEAETIFMSVFRTIRPEA